MQVESAGGLQARKRICDGDFRDHKELSNRRKHAFDESDTALVEIDLLAPSRSMAKRRYTAHSVSKSTDCDGENSETDSSLDFARQCGHISPEQHHALTGKCAAIGRMLGGMIKKSESFLVQGWKCGFGVPPVTSEC